jgi:hypothetical protein
MPYKFHPAALSTPASAAGKLLSLLDWKSAMNALGRQLRRFVMCLTVSIFLILSACRTPSATPAGLDVAEPLGTPVGTSDQATLLAGMTQEKNNADNQAAATAEIVRANALATLNSANATVGAAQTQNQSNANIIAAQIASTAEIERAHAQATLVAAGSTQSAALTQDAIQQTEAVNQQSRDQLAAGTQTAVANDISTQTQAALATSQWYSDQSRQRDEQRQGPISFLWMWCLPVFVILLAGLGLWGFWRWLRIKQANQRILVKNPEQIDSWIDLESDVVDSSGQLTNPDDQVHQWLDEVKRKLLNGEKNDYDNPVG